MQKLVVKFFKNKLAKLISSSDMEKNSSKSFSDAINWSDIEEQIIKQLNTPKPLDVENNCEEEINFLHHKIWLVILIGANVHMSVNQWWHLLKVSAYSIAPAKILEREGSMSPFSFYGQLPDY